MIKLNSNLGVTFASFLLVGSISKYTAVAAPITQTSSIAVIVNQDPITKEDIQKRAIFVLLSSGKDVTALTPQLLSQVQEALIQEKLQRQIASRLEIKVTQEDINRELTQIAKENNMTLEQMKIFFTEKGVSIATLAERIKTNMLWMKAIGSAFSYHIKVTDKEIDEELARLQANEAKEQLLLSEIVLFVNDPSKQASVQAKMQSLLNDLKAGTPFHVIARNFSEAPSSAQGGVTGWIPKDLAPSAAISLAMGQYSEPILQGNRYIIYYCNDLKKPGEAAASEAKISFNIAKFEAPADVDVPPAELAEFLSKAPNIEGCEVFKQTAEQHKGQVVENTNVSAANIHEEMMKILSQTEILKVSQPIRVSPAEIIMMMPCTRKTVAKSVIPSRVEVKRMLLNKKIQTQAESQFNKIKSTATIEYRSSR